MQIAKPGAVALPFAVAPAPRSQRGALVLRGSGRGEGGGLGRGLAHMSRWGSEGQSVFEQLRHVLSSIPGANFCSCSALPKAVAVH